MYILRTNMIQIMYFDEKQQFLERYLERDLAWLIARGLELT